MKTSYIYLLFIILVSLTPLYSATIVWDGDTNDNWTDSNNWTGGTTPTDDLATDQVRFDSTGQGNIDFSADRSIGSIKFKNQTSAYTFQNSSGTNTLTIGDATTVESNTQGNLHLDGINTVIFNMNVQFDTNDAVNGSSRSNIAVDEAVTLDFNNNVQFAANSFSSSEVKLTDASATVRFDGTLQIDDLKGASADTFGFGGFSDSYATSVIAITGDNSGLWNNGGNRAYTVYGTTIHQGHTNALDGKDLTFREHYENNFYITSSGVTNAGNIEIYHHTNATGKSTTIGSLNTSGTATMSGNITYELKDTSTVAKDARFYAESGGTFEISGAINPTESYSSAVDDVYSKTGAGTVILSGSNDFSNGHASSNEIFTISGGTLRTKSATALNGINVLNISGGSIDVDDTADDYTDYSLTGTGTLASGGTYIWDIEDFTGTTAGTHWDKISFSSSLNITSTSGSPFNIVITRPNSASDNYASIQTKDYEIISASSITGFNADYFNLDTSSMGGDTNWSIIQTGNSLFLHYEVVPEPSTWFIIGLTTLLISFRLLKTKLKKSSHNIDLINYQQ